MVSRFSEAFPGKTFQPLPPSGSSKKDEKQSAGLCKFWLNSGLCPKSECHFEHASGELATQRRKYVQERLENRARLQLLEHEADNDEDAASSLLSRHQRASIFADWLRRTFRHVFREDGDGSKNSREAVLDVAGGRGDLAFELSVKRRLKPEVVIIDPRGQKVRRWQTKLLKQESQEDVLPEHVQALFDENVFDHERLQDREVELVLGMHPDEATEPIVDVALAKKIPFAVIPCCVFAHLFPERRLENGQEPRSYQQFCDYLAQKNGDIKRDRLGFRGRDTVLYWIPKS